MRQITIDGEPGVALWDDDSPLIAFRPHGTTEWRYILRPTPTRDTDWHPEYEEAE